VLLSRSDKALYRAKQNRGGHVLASELRVADNATASRQAVEGVAA
jgi:hypothetical protein